MSTTNGAAVEARIEITIAGKTFPLVTPDGFTYREAMRAEELAGMSTAELLGSFDERRFSTRAVRALIEISAARSNVRIPESVYDENWLGIVEAFTGAFGSLNEEPPEDPTNASTGRENASTANATTPSTSQPAGV